jgi:hypothetical protein
METPNKMGPALPANTMVTAVTKPKAKGRPERGLTQHQSWRIADKGVDRVRAYLIKLLDPRGSSIGRTVTDTTCRK